MTTKVLGIQDLKRECARLSDELAKAEDPAEMAGGIPIRDAWKGFVPILEGHYRDSLTVAKVGTHTAVGTAMVPGLPAIEQPFIYAQVLELGTYGHRAQPSAKPALEASRAEATAAAAVPLRATIRGRRPRRPRPTT